jgi:hypothetical protein
MFELLHRLHVLGVLLENKQLGETLKGGGGGEYAACELQKFRFDRAKRDCRAGQGKRDV